MCCEDEIPSYPAAVAEMLAAATSRLRSPQTWGADSWGASAVVRPLHYAGDAALEALWAGFTDRRGPTTQEVAATLLGAVDVDKIPGLVLLSVGDEGPTWTAPAQPVAVNGADVEMAVLVSCTASAPVQVVLGDDTVLLRAGEHALLEMRLEPEDVSIHARIDGAAANSPAVLTRVPGGLIELSARTEARWTVTGEDGRAHFAQTSFRKWDVHGRGYFHLQHGAVAVPPGQYLVRAVRGIEFRPFETVVEVDAGMHAIVAAELERRVDPHADGWWSADLHVHANYGGEYAITADDAMLMQRGEGLDFMNLVAANQLTEHVHDISLFRTALGHQLPGSHEAPAHAGLEYRNDLYGHMHITGAQRDLGRYQTGHAQGSVTVDWPSNHDAAAAYRAVGATVGYCHPVFPVWGSAPEDALERVMGRLEPRTNEARCAVLDAALGVVDSIDVLSNGDDLASAQLYRRMVGAGYRVAATAGSDAMLSLRHLGVHSNPPGWVRLYARTGDGITLSSLQTAVRSGRTIATNGPWIELAVDGHGPGDDLLLDAPSMVTATVRVTTDGPCIVRLFRGSQIAHEWHVAPGEAADGWSSSAGLQITSSDAVMVEVVGTADPLVLDDIAYAHTSPVHVRVAGLPVRRTEDVDWCLLWLERLRDVVARHGRGIHEHLEEIDAGISAAGAWLRRPLVALE